MCRPQVDFQSIVSNAKIGNVLAGTAATRLGVTQVGAFTTSTKVQKVGKYVTYRFDFGVAAAGAHVDIWGATKTGNDWSAFSQDHYPRRQCLGRGVLLHPPELGDLEVLSGHVGRWWRLDPSAPGSLDPVTLIH